MTTEIERLSDLPQHIIDAVRDLLPGSEIYYMANESGQEFLFRFDTTAGLPRHKLIFHRGEYFTAVTPDGWLPIAPESDIYLNPQWCDEQPGSIALHTLELDVYPEWALAAYADAPFPAVWMDQDRTKLLSVNQDRTRAASFFKVPLKGYEDRGWGEDFFDLSESELASYNEKGCGGVRIDLVWTDPRQPHNDSVPAVTEETIEINVGKEGEPLSQFVADPNASDADQQQQLESMDKILTILQNASPAFTAYVGQVYAQAWEAKWRESQKELTAAHRQIAELGRVIDVQNGVIEANKQEAFDDHGLDEEVAHLIKQNDKLRKKLKDNKKRFKQTILEYADDYTAEVATHQSRFNRLQADVEYFLRGEFGKMRPSSRMALQKAGYFDRTKAEFVRLEQQVHDLIEERDAAYAEISSLGKALNRRAQLIATICSEFRVDLGLPEPKMPSRLRVAIHDFMIEDSLHRGREAALEEVEKKG